MQGKTLLCLVIIGSIFCGQAFGQTVSSGFASNLAEPAHRVMTESKVVPGTISKVDAKWEQGGIFEGKLPGQEILDKRTELSKKFDNGDGTTDVIIGGPFHYKDDDGAWQDIDYSIRELGTGIFKFVNRSNRFISRFGSIPKNGVEMEHDGRTISFGIEPMITSGNWTPQAGMAIPSVVLENGSIVYKNVFQDVDLEYDLNSERVQHRMVFNRSDVFSGLSASQQYIDVREELHLPSGAQMSDDQGIISSSRKISGNITVSIDGEAVYTIIESRAWDAGFNGDIYEASSYTEGFTMVETHVTISPEGEVTLIAKLPVAWLLSPSRVFPIVLDPDVYVGGVSSPSLYYRYPFNTCRTQRVSQILFKRSDIGMSGAISSIAFYRGNSSGASASNVTIKMQSVNWNPAAFTTCTHTTSGWTTMASSQTISTSSGWKNISLSSYNYSNTQDLLIETRFSNSSASGGCSCTSFASAGGGWGYVSASYNGHRWAYSNTSASPPTTCISSPNDCPVEEQNSGYGNIIPSVRITIGSSCTNWYASPSSANLTSSSSCGNSFSVYATGTGCSYSPISNDSWINNFSYPGGGVTNYCVDVNNTGVTRTGTISIRDASNYATVATYTVVQAAASCSTPSTPSNPTISSSQCGSVVIARTGSVPSGQTWYWQSTSCGTSTSYGSGSTYNASSSGTYYIRARDNSGGCWSSGCGSVSVSIPTLPSTPPNPTSNSPQTNSVTISRSGTPPSGTNWYWQHTACGTSTSYGFGSTYTATSSGTYYIRAYNTSTGCWSAGCGSTQVTVNTPPPTVSSISANPNNISAGNSVAFSANVSNSPTQWQWTFSGGTPYTTITASSQNPSVVFVRPGCYRVTLRAWNSGGGWGNTYSSSSCFVTVSPTSSNYPPPPNNYVIQQGYPSFPVADPINIATGSYEYKHTDFNIPAVNTSLNFTRYYSSVNAAVDGPLGYGWSHSYDWYVIDQADTLWNVHYGDGHNSYFIPVYNGNGTSFPLYGGTHETLYKDPVSGHFSLTLKTGEVYAFNGNGKLASITDRNGNVTTLSYSSNNLISVSAPGGRALSMTYSGNRIVSVADALGRYVSFSYSGSGDLALATNPDAGTTVFSYIGQHLVRQIVTPSGNVLLTNSYDGQNRVVEQSDALGLTTAIAYDTPGPQYSTVSLPDGSNTIVHHDAYYRLDHQTDELGASKTFSFDYNNNITSITDENGNTTNYTYDNSGNRLTIVKPGSVTTQIAYNAFNKPQTITDPGTNVSSLTYNVNADLTQVTLANGATQNFTYFGNGLIQTFTDGLSNTTTYAYNSFGDLVSVTSPSGIRTFTYDASGRRTSQTDENGNVTTYQYNNNDMVTVVTDPLTAMVQYGFDVDNNLISLTDKNGNQTQLTYDGKSRLISIQDAQGGTNTFAYDVRDNVVTITDANGNTIQNGYDAKKRLISKTTALGTSQYAYDAVGNLTSETDPLGNSKTFNYNALGQRTSTADGLGNTTVFSYNSLGQITGIEDPLGRNTSYTYNPVGLITGIVDAAGMATSATYDANGNRLTITDANSNTQLFSYNASNRLSSYTDASGNVFSFSYDGVGNLTMETKPTGTIARTFDANDRVTNVVNSSGDSYVYTYDANGNKLTSSNNTGTSSFIYDNLNRLVQHTDVFGNAVAYTYDAVGNKTSITYPGNLTVNYGYDADNNMVLVTDWLGNSTAYDYDGASRLVEMNYPNGVSCNYAYDVANRLISKSNTLGSTIINQSIFTLDANGNRTQENRQGPIPSLLTAASFAYTYGQDDRLLSDSITAYINDGAGNRISQTNSDGTTVFNFSVDNILNSMVTSTATTSYRYDADKNRVERVEDGEITRHVLDPSDDLSQVLQEQDANGNVKAHYIYGLGLIARIDSASTVLYYHFDAQHNTVALTNDSAQITDTYTYEPFGTMLSHEGNTQQPFTFLGEYGVQQETSSIYYIRARYYDSANGRFLSKDPYPASLLNPQTLNRYVYSLNNPVSMFDVNGLYGNSDNNGSSYGGINAFLNQYAGDIGEIANELADLLLDGSLGTATLGEIFTVLGLYQYYLDVQTTVDQYVNGSIGYWEAWDVLVTGAVAALSPPGFDLVHDYVAPAIMNGYLDSILWLGDVIGGAFYDLFN